jgi:outer membrane protein TolC
MDLETALLLAGAENPTIALAREAVNASLAALLRARAALLPTLDGGASFDSHTGNLLSAQGIVRDVDRQALYAGAGASTVGAGTVTVPGVRLTAQVAEALFEPRIARQVVVSRRLDARATRDAVLLDVVLGYFALVGAEARQQAIRQSEADLAEIVRLTANFARIGQGREGDAERARSEALLLHDEEQRAEEEVAVAAAELTRLLSVDPSYRVRGPAGPIPLVELVDLGVNVHQLIQLALANHPEIGARTADVAAGVSRLREEKWRPLVPLLAAGFSVGTFGGGSNLTDTHFGHFDERSDFDFLAVWTLRNLGMGDLAVQRQRRAQIEEAEAERVRVIDRVRREITESHALALTRRQELDVARQRIETAQRAYRLDLERSKNLQGRPIEVLNSLNLLNAARQDLVRALIGYNQAQFQLFVALGQPPDLPLAGPRL